MSQLHLETWQMPAADLGPENPLPPLRIEGALHAVEYADPDIPADMQRNLTYGRVSNVLPYAMQDGYTRQRRPRNFCAAVLENEHLRATFMPELGGRLWSLFHKPSGRELLAVNPVFQPANLALRNAWFSGGVEWNIGTIGHSPFTCAPLFAAQVEGPHGVPVLRMYEWERIRQIPFQIDAYLPDGSPVLFIHVRIINPHNRTIPMYWWSNIAVPETPDTRVITPSNSVYRFNYNALNIIPAPVVDGTDFTYATRLNRSLDFFYHIPADRRRWIAALDGDGAGLVQTSTGLLKGRKLFVWGMGSGGRRWQEFLSPPGQPYIEIQAGLARTQLEHLPMPPGEWAWLEAYGLLQSDPAAVHGDNWMQSQQTVEENLEQLIPRTTLDAEFKRSAAFSNTPPAKILQRGSGWGALERHRREAAGESPFCSAGLVFDNESLTSAQMPWLNLLRSGAMPASDEAPFGFMVQAEWQDLLQAAINKRRKNWLVWFHLGVMHYQAKKRNDARHAWEQSLAQTKTPWALRNLAVLAMEDKKPNEAIQLYLTACRMRPLLLPLIVECGRVLINAGQPHNWLDLLADLPASICTAGRIRFLQAQAALAVGDFETVEQLFTDRVIIPDMREGEESLSDLWLDYHARRLSATENMPLNDALHARVRREFPVPQMFDFRMNVE